MRGFTEIQYVQGPGGMGVAQVDELLPPLGKAFKHPSLEEHEVHHVNVGEPPE